MKISACVLLLRLVRGGRHHRHLGDQRLSGFPARPHERPLDHARWPPDRSAPSSTRFSLPIKPRSGASLRRRTARSISAPATADGFSNLMPRVTARWCGLPISLNLRGRRRPRGRGLRRHVARRQGLSHRERPRHGILFARRALHLGAGVRARRFALRRHRAARENLSRHRCGPGRSLLRDRPVPRHRAGVRSRRPPARGQRAQRNSVSHHRHSRARLRAVRREPAGDPQHYSRGRRLHLRRGARRQRGEAHFRRVQFVIVVDAHGDRACYQHHRHRRASRPRPCAQAGPYQGHYRGLAHHAPLRPPSKSPASNARRSTRFSPTTPSRLCGVRRTKTSTTWSPTPRARSRS